MHTYIYREEGHGRVQQTADPGLFAPPPPVMSKMEEVIGARARVAMAGSDRDLRRSPRLIRKKELSARAPRTRI
jgi:hypothetical protein